MAVGDLLRYAFIALVFFVVLIFGLKWWGKQKAENELVRDLQSLTGATSSFGQFYEADAEKALFQTMSKFHLAEKELGLSPRELLDLVFHTEEESEQSGRSRSRRKDNGEFLIRSSLLRNYENSKRLGLFSNSLSFEALEGGEAPQIQSGPAAGSIVRISFIISPDVSPGIEKIIPNFIIGPLDKQDDDPTEFEITRAKRLANALYDANLLEAKSRDRIIQHYQNIASPPVPDEEDGEKAEEG